MALKSVLIVLLFVIASFYFFLSPLEVIKPYSTKKNYHRAFSLTAGDLNSDSIDDLVISSPKDGKLYIYWGPLKKDALTSMNDYDVLIDSRERTNVGFSFTNDNMIIRDMNGDGRNDLIVADPDKGSLYLIRGDLLQKDGKHKKIYIEDSSLELTSEKKAGLGSSMALWNFSSNQWPDLIIGAPLKNKWRGAIYILKGSALKESLDKGDRKKSIEEFAARIIEGDNEGDNFGWAVALAKVNNDNYEDLIVSARLGLVSNGERTGRLYVFEKKEDSNNELGRRQVINGINEGDHIGRVLHTVDLDEDGLKDLLVGTTHAKCNHGEKHKEKRNRKPVKKGCGEVYLVYNKTLRMMKEELSLENMDSILFASTEKGYRYGWLIISGDFNNNKKNDIVISAKFAGKDRHAPEKSGKLFFLEGGSLPDKDIKNNNFKYSKIVYGDEDHGNLGLAGTVGDINGDGIADLIVSSITGHNFFWKKGKVNIYYGNKNFFPEK